MKIKLAISPWHYTELIKKSYSLDVLYILKMIDEGVDIEELLEVPKINAIIQSVYRKGLVSEDGSLTIMGKELLQFMASSEKKRFKKKVIVSTEFEEWWKTFPGTDTFVWEGKHFTGCRSLRQNKEKCREKFAAILLEGDHTAKEIIDATEYDVSQKKIASKKIGTNKLTYLQNSLTYLNQKSYEPFIDLIKDGNKIEENKTVGGTDI